MADEIKKLLGQRERFKKLQNKLGIQTKSISEDEPIETAPEGLFHQYTNPKAMKVDEEYVRARRAADAATGSEAGQTMDDFLKSSDKQTLSTGDLLREHDLPAEYYPQVSRLLQQLREARLKNLK